MFSYVSMMLGRASRHVPLYSSFLGFLLSSPVSVSNHCCGLTAELCWAYPMCATGSGPIWMSQCAICHCSRLLLRNLPDTFISSPKHMSRLSSPHLLRPIQVSLMAAASASAPALWPTLLLVRSLALPPTHSDILLPFLLVLTRTMDVFYKTPHTSTFAFPIGFFNAGWALSLGFSLSLYAYGIYSDNLAPNADNRNTCSGWNS